ncbi:hypothetical protein M407DRAFT_245454, partial [Tulasnella calospora MUT 4182]
MLLPLIIELRQIFFFWEVQVSISQHIILGDPIIGEVQGARCGSYDSIDEERRPNDSAGAPKKKQYEL